MAQSFHAPSRAHSTFPPTPARSSSSPTSAPPQPSAAPPFVSLLHLSHALPDGRVLLDDISYDFATARHGLIGRNGTGKTLLLRLLHGEFPPQSGRIARRGRIAYAPQTLPRETGVTLADVAGIAAILRALSNLESGSARQEDFDLADGHWRIREEWARMLADAGLPAWTPEHPARAASGGELTRVALAGALLHAPRTACCWTNPATTWMRAHAAG